MEKSVKNAVFKGFPVLMESDTFGSKQNSQTINKETNMSEKQSPQLPETVSNEKLEFPWSTMAIFSSDNIITLAS